MDDVLKTLERKNKTSADLFLVSVILTIIFTLAIIVLFMMFDGLSSIIIRSMTETATGGLVKPTDNVSNADKFLYISEQLYLLWIMCFIAAAAQITAFAMMIAKSPAGRIAGIAAFVISVLMFPPLFLVQLYGLLFLVSTNGKDFYNSLR